MVKTTKIRNSLILGLLALGELQVEGVRASMDSEIDEVQLIINNIIFISTDTVPVNGQMLNN